MKKTKKYLIGGCVLFATLVCFVSVTATAITNKKEISLFSDGSITMDDAVVFIDELQKKDLNKLIDEVNDLDFSTTAEDKVGYYYEVIRSKLVDTPMENITTELLDAKNTDDVKINILALCEAEGVEIDYDKLLPMLDDDNTSAALKGVLIDLISGEGNKYADEIEAQALAGKESSILEALTALQSLRPKKAEMIANDILSDLTNAFSEKYKAALITKANSLQSNSTQQETEKFISICDNILNGMPAEDADEKDITVLYALSMMQRRETLAYLMNLESDLAESFRSYIVDENQAVIDDILDEVPSSESVNLLSKVAPYYVPQKIFIEKINMYLTANERIFNENNELKTMLLEVIK